MEKVPTERDDLQHEIELTEADMVGTSVTEPPAFSNDLILDCIFQHLSTHDLLTCGLINKKWNWNSRVYLQEKRNSLAKVQDCQQLKELNDLLALSSLPLPFNGLFICGGHNCTDESCPEDCYQYLCEDPVIFTRLKLKLLSQSGLDCPAMQFVKRYFQEGSPLEQLEIISLPSGINTLKNTFQGMELNMKNLKTVIFPMRKYEGLVDEVTSVAKNLQTILGQIGEEEVEILRKNGKLYALKDFFLEPEGIPQMESCGQLALERLKLRFMKISSGCYRSNGGDLQVYQTIALSMLNSSKNSLEKLQIGHLDMILLMHSENMPVMNKLRHISVRYSLQADIVAEFPTLRRINFPRYFPNLESIEITATAAPSFTSWYITNDFRNSLEEFECHSLRKLRINKIDFPTQQTWFDWMKQLFPNVKEFEITDCGELGSYLTSAWTTWPDLEQVSIITGLGLGLQNRKMNLDAVFCGITEDEMQELLSKDDNFLRNYQYAPIKPSLQNLLHLQRLTFQAQHFKAKKENIEFLTYLTGYLVLDRVREKNVIVQVVRKECQNSCQPCVFLDQLRPFMNIVDQ